jgi:hypothetical protein
MFPLGLIVEPNKPSKKMPIKLINKYNDEFKSKYPKQTKQSNQNKQTKRKINRVNKTKKK